MPRPPKFYHPLREIRAAAGGLSQTSFAELVGVSMPTIQAIEGGKLRLTPKLAARIAEATGASESELLKGAQGKARTLEGTKYTAAAFQNWQASRQRRAKPHHQGPALLQWCEWLLGAAQTSGEASMMKARTQLIESMEKIRIGLGLEDQINAGLLPFQSVETFSADISQWKKAQLPKVQRLGYHSSIPLGGKTRFTLSWQITPTWSPGSLPPAPAPTNVDLIPAGYCVIGLGTAGCRMAEAWWKGLCRDHGISPEHGQAIHVSPTGNWQGFFRKVPQITEPDKYVPRAIFADLDPSSLQTIAMAGSDLFHPAAFCFGEQASGNVFAGAHHPSARGLVEAVLRLLARQAQDVGGVSGVFLLHSLEGGTGGGLAQQLLGKLKNELPASPVVCVCPLPDPSLGHSVTAPYNLALTLDAVSQGAHAALLFDPQRLEEEAIRQWKVEPRDVENMPNRLIASSLCAFSGPLRFPGADAVPLLLPDWLRMVCGEGQSGELALLAPEIRPLQAKLSAKSPIHTAEEIVKACTASCRTTTSPIPVTLLLRGRRAEDVWGTARASGFLLTEKFRITPQRSPEGFETCTLIQEARGEGPRFQEFALQASRLLERRAYLHWYEALEISESDLAKAVLALRKVANRLLGNEVFP